MEITEFTISELHNMIKEKKISSLEITKGILSRIEKLDKKFNAYIKVYFEDALKQAEKADERIKKNENLHYLTGIPVAIKDNICVEDWEITCASKILKGFISPYNATVIEKLKNEGSILIGRTNMDEFAMGSSTENSSVYVTRNPWDIDRVPGGSSGGTASAVRSGIAIAGLGSDTGGSIRQPASCCGVVGLKPTYGRVSRFGLIAFASSLDQIGPITKNVTDSAILARVISGYDRKDSTSGNIPVPDYLESIKKGINDLKIGVPKEYFIKGIDKDVEEKVKDAILTLEKLGAKIIEVSLPHTEYCLPAYYLIATAEASSNLARFDGVQYGYRKFETDNVWDMYSFTRKDGFGTEVKRRIMLGTYALSAGYYDAYYLKALKVRTLIKSDFDNVFKICDAIVTPTSPTPAFKIGEKISDPVQMYLSDVFTTSVNLAGLPAISIPCGFSKENLPIGLQIISKEFNEEIIFRIAYQYEQNTEWHKRNPDEL